MAKKVNRTKIILVSALFAIIFLPSFVKYQSLLYKNRSLEERIKFLTEDNKRLEKERMRLETDISYIEKTAREAMGVVRKGEIVIKDTQVKR
jgi:cell division protein FtsB